MTTCRSIASFYLVIRTRACAATSAPLLQIDFAGDHSQKFHGKSFEKGRPAPRTVRSRKSMIEKRALTDGRFWVHLILLVVTLLCFWTPMTSDGTSILWDAADYYQVVQNYLSQELYAGRIPFWSPLPVVGLSVSRRPAGSRGIHSIGRSFLIGVSPHVLFVEHWLHFILLACLGAYFLA